MGCLSLADQEVFFKRFISHQTTQQSIWTCGNCSLENAPHTTECELCNMQAPPNGPLRTVAQVNLENKLRDHHRRDRGTTTLRFDCEHEKWMNYLRGYNSRVKWEQENGIQPDESLQEAKKIVDDQYRIVVRAKQYYYGEE